MLIQINHSYFSSRWYRIKEITNESNVTEKSIIFNRSIRETTSMICKFYIFQANKRMIYLN